VEESHVEKQKVAYLGEKISGFHGTEGSVPFSQELATDTNPEPDDSIPRHFIIEDPS
jgi:hypothetical protein